MTPQTRILLSLITCSVLLACTAQQDSNSHASSNDRGEEQSAEQDAEDATDTDQASIADGGSDESGEQPVFNLKHPAVDLGIVCSDFDKSLHFYRDILGLKVVFEIQIPENVAKDLGLAPRKFRQVRLQAGHTLIKLMEIESPPQERTFDFQSGVQWLTLIIDDVPGCVARLKEAGVEFVTDEPSEPDDARYVISAKGPDGMIIEFVQPFE